jgi:hypothetical protein
MDFLVKKKPPVIFLRIASQSISVLMPEPCRRRGSASPPLENPDVRREWNRRPDQPSGSAMLRLNMKPSRSDDRGRRFQTALATRFAAWENEVE